MKPKTIKILYWIFTIIYAAFMLLSGGQELMQTASAQKVIVDLGYPVYVNYILGFAKLIAAVILVVPSLIVLKEWAYAGLTIDLIGAVASYIFVSGAAALSGLLFFIPFFAVLFLSYGFWRKVKKIDWK